ncbi:ArsR/SmtB family transcription factor [Halovenus rubra]|uniref:ArsR/SmtB family transcription factor n=2 Tax=Halovenus rubra TaxID=869890 RepID=A0ACC7DWD6_9EURY|nr:helix-turn-helix domain-containing protein [Halovenus rubra]
MDVPVTAAELDEITAEKAFSILGNETRIAVLQELWRADEPCSFSELQKTVAPDDRGNFSYHLGKLAGHFIRKTDEGYSLRFAGEQVVRAVLTGTITSDPTMSSDETNQECLYCNTQLQMSYEEETLNLRCENCAGLTARDVPHGTTMNFEFPPAGLLGRDYEEIIYAADVLYDSKISPMIKGICPECTGQVSRTFTICSEHEHDDDGGCPNCETRYEHWGTFQCDDCRYSRSFPLWYAALNHPAATAFLYTNGHNEKVPFRKVTWDNRQFVQDITGTTLQEDPYKFRITFPVEDERLQLTLDDELDVIAVEKVKK